MKAELLYIQKLTYDENTGNEIIGLFPSEYNPAIVSSYTYDAKRMGGAPTLTATIYSSEPLQWKKEEFVEYNGDRFFASYTPNSTKDNSSRMWKSEITFSSRRELLDNTLFFDVVVDDVDTQNKDRYRSNQTKFTFGGTIYEFVARINSSMAYCGLYRPTDEYKGYYVVVDEGYGTDEVKEVSFEDQYLTDVLQLINTTFELDYYWDGNVCHVGKVQHDLTDTPIKYGCSDALISVSKENANYKIVDMITGYGSSDNLPYYYPNDDEFGKADYSAVNFDKSLVKDVDLSKIFSWCGGEAYNKKITLCKNTESKYSANIIGNSPVFTRTFGGLSTVGLTDADKTTYPQITTTVDGASASFYLGYIRWKGTNGSQNSSRSDGFVIASIFELDEKPVEGSIEFSNLKYDVTLKKTFKTQLSSVEEETTLAKLDFTYEYYLYVGEDMKLEKCKEWLKSITLGGYVGDKNHFALGDSIPNMTQYKINDKCPMIINGKCCVLVFCRISTKTGDGHTLAEIKPTGSIDYIYEPNTTQYYWSSSDNKSVAIGNSGIDVDERLYDNAISANYTLQNGAWVAIGVSGSTNAPSIVINGRIYTTPSQNLMPSIYRESGGSERFYYAKNDTYLIPGTSDHYKFVNLYKKGNPHQGSVTFDDIKPTINGIVNAEGQLFGEIADVAFDKEDSDVKDSDGNYIHSYFYIKLHKFNGDFGFDLFNHVLSKEPAKINLIKSNGCPACSFVIHNQPSADNSKCYNCVSVDENGNLKQVRTDKNDYIFDNASDAYEDNLNQDSTHKELWIAVQKDTSTLGIIMPNASAGFKPQNGDLFVITGIKPPKVLVTAAEKRLDDALIRHMSENNTDQFNYSVKFSRIFLQENPDFASKLNENAKLSIQIQGDSDSDGNLISHEVFVSNYSVKVDNDELAEVEVELVNSLEVTKSDVKQIIDSVKGETVKSLSSMVGGSNTNSFNASITDKMYLSKLKDDTSNGKITFIKGLIAKGLADLMMGARFGNNAKITELGEAFFSAIKSLDYDNAAEQGFSVEKENNGKYHAFFTNLTIWGKAIFHELEVRKRSYSGGNIYLSGAGSKLIKVVPVKKLVSADGVTSWVETTDDDSERFGWKCYLLADNGTTATMNYWQEGDQARCQTMGEIAAGGAYSDVSNKSYWRTIPNGGVSTQNEKIYGTKKETYLDEDGNEQTRDVQVELYDGQAFAWIVIGKHCGDIDGYDDEFSVGYNGSNPAPLNTIDIPSAGDTIVLDGNRHRNIQGEYDKTDRQNVIILETTGEYAPRIACYANITEYKHTFTKRVNNIDKEVSLSVFETSPKGGTKINSSRFEWISDDGSTINIINYRGDWDGNNTYHKNDQVNHNNAVWVCVANSGVDVTEEPRDGLSNWKKVLSGVKGDKGDKGEDGLSGNGIVPAYIRSNDNPTPPTSTDKNNLDNGWSLEIPSGADVKNVSYSDSSWTDYNDGVHTWKKSPITADSSTSSCLVTFTTTQSNQVVKFVIKSFSEPRYDYIFLSEIDAASAPSRPTSNGWYRAVSGNGVELSVTDIVATAGTHTVYVCYGKDNSSSFHGDYGLFRIEKMTDIDIPIWQSNGKEVFTRKDSGAINSEIESWSEPFKVTGEDGADGKDGTDGEQGESALEIIVTPETLVFDTNDYGLVPPETSKQASISCYRNGVKVTNVSYDKSAEENCLASVSESNGSATVTISKITSQEVADTSGNSSTISSTISNTSGYTTIQVWDKDTNLYHRVQVKFMVNVAKFTGQMVNTNKRFSNTLTEVSTKVDDKVGSSDLTQFKSEITQTAREISLSVSEKSIGRRNLLVGSAFNRQEGFGLLLDANVRGYGILMNDGVDGMNCIKVASYYDGTRHQYCGAFWGGNHTKNIRIKHGTKYTFSCWVKVLYANTTVYLEVIYNRAEIGNDRDGRPTGNISFAIKEPNKWQLVKWSFTTDDTHDWIEANVFTSSDVAYKTFVASFCKPMLEEGDYNGWTLSEQDYDYVGGNLLDNARTLDKSGMLVVINDTVIQNGYGTDSACAKNLMQANATPSDYKEVLRWNFGSTYLVNGNDYIFSFVAKADVDDARVVCYMWSGDIENSCDIFTEGNGETWDSRSDGNVVFILSRQWTRYWVHWRPKDGYATPKEVIIRHTGNNSTSASTVYVTQPKLEIGATMTEWTERKTDLVDKASLKKAGIEITSDMVELYGNQVKVSGAKGGTPVAMFENGMLNSNLINAAKIIAERLETTGNNGQSVSIENGLMRVYGTNGRCNIEFGVNSNGEAILSYYDKDGKWLYDLGPNKLDGGQLKESTLDGEKYVSALSFFETNDFFDIKKYINVDVKQVRLNYSQRLFGNNLFVNDDQEIANNNAAHMGYKPFERVSASDVTTLYRYTAPRQSGTIIKDETYGLTTAALAKQADGKYFTDNRNLAINGQLANLAPAGYYFRQSEKVMMAPYPMPSAEIQQARFPAYSIRCLNITIDSTGTVMGGFNAMMSSLMRTIKNQI